MYGQLLVGLCVFVGQALGSFVNHELMDIQ